MVFKYTQNGAAIGTVAGLAIFNLAAIIINFPFTVLNTLLDNKIGRVVFGVISVLSLFTVPIALALASMVVGLVMAATCVLVGGAMAFAGGLVGGTLGLLMDTAVGIGKGIKTATQYMAQYVGKLFAHEKSESLSKLVFNKTLERQAAPRNSTEIMPAASNSNKASPTSTNFGAVIAESREARSYVGKSKTAKTLHSSIFGANRFGSKKTLSETHDASTPGGSVSPSHKGEVTSFKVV